MHSAPVGFTHRLSTMVCGVLAETSAKGETLREVYIGMHGQGGLHMIIVDITNTWQYSLQT